MAAIAPWQTCRVQDVGAPWPEFALPPQADGYALRAAVSGGPRVVWGKVPPLRGLA